MSISLSGSLLLTGSIVASGNLTTTGTITAQTLVVQTITSSIVNMTGSNIFGSQLSDRQTFTGSVVMTGSLTVNTTGPELQVTNTGVILGNMLTDNHSVTGSLRVTGSGTSYFLGGNLGVGTTTPSNTLTVQANDTFNQDSSGQLVLRGASNTAKITRMGFDTTNNYGYIQAIEAGVSTRPFVLQPFGGNVGIGTSTPSQRLEVVGGEIKAGRVDTSNEGGQLSFGRALDNNTTWYIDTFGSAASPQLRFVDVDNSAVRMILTGSNVGIGTSSPTGSRATNLVQVAGSLAVLRVGPWFSTDDRDFVEIQADGANTRVYSPNEDFSFHNPVGNANITGSAVNLCGTGNINLRTTAGGSNTLNVYAANAGGANAGLYLECAGAFGAGFFSDRATGQLRGWAASSTAGVSLASNGTSWGSYSDERMKDIIEPIENAVDKVNTLRAVIGKYKTDEDDKRRPFLIAQDVQAVLPEAIYDDKSEDKFLSLSYTDVIPLLVASIKELTARVKELENK